MAAVTTDPWGLLPLRSRTDSGWRQAGGYSLLLFYLARKKISLLVMLADLVAR